MASEWQQITLGEFVTLQRGHDLTASERVAGSVPVMGSNGFVGFHNKAIAPGPGVTIGRSGVGSMGVVNYSPTAYWPHNTTLYVTDFHGNNPRFAYYLLKTINFRPWNSGSAQASLNRNYIYPIPIRIPPHAEQDHIVEILDCLNDKIELNRRMNATLEETARALFKSWFVDFDPVRAKMEGREPVGMDAETAALFPDRLVESELGPIPEGWNIVRLSKISKYIMSGGTPNTQKPEYWNGGIPWLSSGETRSRFIIDTEKTITQLGVQQSSTRSVRSFSTVIASAGQGHTRGQASLLMFESYINQSVVAIAANDQVMSDLYVFFDLSGRYEELRRISDSHSSRGSLTTKLLGDLLIIQPPSELTNNFGRFVKPLTEQIYHNMVQLRTLAETRDALLPKLLSGEVRLEGSP